MKYARHRSQMRSARKKRPPSRKVLLLIIALLVVGMVVFLLIFNGNTNTEEQESVEEVAEMQNGESTNLIAESETSDIRQVGVQSEFEEIEMRYSDGGGYAGFARRAEEGGVFTHVMVLNLPAIDPEVHYYEAWLVKPGITEFFSTGQMFAREDGKFGLIWEQDVEMTEKDLFEYSRVVVTREIRDENPDPSPVHMAEGQF